MYLNVDHMSIFFSPLRTTNTRQKSFTGIALQL